MTIAPNLIDVSCTVIYRMLVAEWLLLIWRIISINILLASRGIVVTNENFLKIEILIKIQGRFS
jgi:hypothetical protein